MWGMYRGPKLSELQSDLSLARSKASEAVTLTHKLMTGLLAEVLKTLSLYNDNCRISVYVQGDGAFYIVGRSSRNPELRKFGRTKYASDQGVIGKAWREQIAVQMNLPSTRPEWEAEMVAQGLPQDVASNLTMHCRSIAAFRLEEDGPGGSRHIGIVVVESLNAREINGRKIDTMTHLAEWNMVRAAIESSRTELPQVAMLAAEHRLTSVQAVAHRA